MGEWKWIQLVYITWPRWLPCPYIKKIIIIKISFSGTKRLMNLETWYAALVTRVLANLFKWRPWVGLDLVYSEVKFGSLCFGMGKCLSCRFPRNYWSIWGECRCTYSQMSTWWFMTTQGKGHSLTFVQGHSDSTFPKFFFSWKQH